MYKWSNPNYDAVPENYVINITSIANNLLYVKKLSEVERHQMTLDDVIAEEDARLRERGYDGEPDVASLFDGVLHLDWQAIRTLVVFFHCPVSSSFVAFSSNLSIHII